MGAAAFGLCSDLNTDALLAVFARIAPYAQIPLMAIGTTERLRELSAKIPEIGLFYCEDEMSDVLSLLHDAKEPQLFAKDSELIFAASGAEAFFVDATIDFSEEIECIPDFPENILKAEDEGGGLKIRIRGEDDIDLLEQYQYMINRPVCFCSDSPELLEAALKTYNGRAFFDGTCDIEDIYLKYLQEYYGLIVL